MTTAITTHLVFFLFLGIVSVFSAEDPPEPEVRFVKINQEQLAQLGKKAKPPEKPKPPKPKKKPPAVKPKAKPEKVKKNKKQPTKKRPTTRVASAKKHPTSKNAKSTAPSRDPNAGGGFGKGNVSNRDINQTGILSMIGEGVGEMPSTTIAAVTNLDAVASPGAGGKSFKVGGVKGKLGNGRISVPNTSVVKTKGSKQVLRSAGASGKGRVAALEKGAVGQKKVKGLVVKARLTKSVKIRGGMSREAVKRVIDRHMAEVYFCYETALIANPSIMGRMIYEWKIKMDGSVGEVKIKSSSVNSHEMHACIKEAIRSWRFPQPSGTEVVVSYPFVFDIVGF